MTRNYRAMYMFFTVATCDEFKHVHEYLFTNVIYDFSFGPILFYVRNWLHFIARFDKSNLADNFYFFLYLFIYLFIFGCYVISKLLLPFAMCSLQFHAIFLMLLRLFVIINQCQFAASKINQQR